MTPSLLPNRSPAARLLRAPLFRLLQLLETLRGALERTRQTIEGRRFPVRGFLSEAELQPFEEACWRPWPRTPYLGADDALWSELRAAVGLHRRGCELCGQTAAPARILLCSDIEVAGGIPAPYAWHPLNLASLCAAHADALQSEAAAPGRSRTVTAYLRQRRRLVRQLRAEAERELRLAENRNRALERIWKRMRQDLLGEIHRGVPLLRERALASDGTRQGESREKLANGLSSKVNELL